MAANDAEFRISTISSPLAIRTGITDKAFNQTRNHKTIKGAPNGLAAEIGALRVADQLFGSKLGLLQKCVGIQWGGGFTVYAASTGEVPGLATVAASKDGVTWEAAAQFPGGAICGVAGNTKDGMVLVAGGYYQNQIINDGAFVMAPQFYISTDRGKSWSISRPAWDTTTTNNFEGVGFTMGCVTGVGYDPGSQTFYAVVQEVKQTPHVNFVARQLFYSGGAGGFNQISSQAVFTVTGVTPFIAPPQAPWPSGAFVNDTPVVTDNVGNPGAKFVYATSPNQSVRYCAVNVSPQHMSEGTATVDMAPDNTLSSTIGGTSVFSTSGALSPNFLFYVDDKGAVHNIPTDPSSTSGGVQDFGSGFSMDQSLIGGSIYYTFDGFLSSVLESAMLYASVSFTKPSKSNP